MGGCGAASDGYEQYFDIVNVPRGATNDQLESSLETRGLSLETGKVLG